MCGCLLKAIEAISNIAHMPFDLKTNTDQTFTNIMKAMTQTCIGSIAILGHANSPIQENWRDHIDAWLNTQYTVQKAK